MPLQNHASEELAADWQAAAQRYPEALRRRMLALASRHKVQLATVFYERMMADAAASFFLSDRLVQTRLHASMQRWLEGVFTVGLDGGYAEAIQVQRHVGEVHARVGVPTHLVMRGTRAIMGGLVRLLEQEAPEDRADGARYFAETLGLATEVICQSYSVQHDRQARAEESYRLFAVSQNIGAERERQRAALLDWENQLMFEATVNAAWDRLPSLGRSEFGLWFMHKAVHAFEGAPSVQGVVSLIEQIDASLTRVAGNGGAPDAAVSTAAIRELRERSRAIRMLVDGLFEQAGHLESGRDALTRLLNRKYLPVIMAREIDYARRHGSGLAVLALDVDHFKRINDRYGHDGGDAVLQQLGLFLSQSVRGGDYLFRLGGEEFLVVLVDIDVEQALTVAQKLCRRVHDEPISIRDNETLHVTLSIGVALHDGHPDYQRLLKTADRALYRAKREGRNRVQLASAEDASGGNGDVEIL